MRRQRRMHANENYDYSNNIDYAPINNGIHDDSDHDDFLMHERKQAQRFENTLEAKIEEGDTLASIALRYHCTVSDIKRLNKIDKDNEIYARKVVKIPVTVHSVLLGTLPAVHTSGNSSPKHKELDIIRNPLEEASALLDEKLLLASVSNSGVSNSRHVNSAALNSKIASKPIIYKDQGM